MATSRLTGRLSLLLLAFAVMASIAALATGFALKADKADAQAAPTIQSDKDDYPPGGLVTLTGSNWQPGETVNIYVNDDVGRTWERSVDVTADASGNITDQFNLPDWFVAVYQVRATGATGAVATTSFTDGTVAVRARGVPQGTTARIDWTEYSDTTCSGNVLGSGSINAGTQGFTGIPGRDVGPSESIRLTAGNVSGYTFSSWSDGTFITSGSFSTTSNPGCLAGSGSTQNTSVNYTQVTTQNTNLSVSPASGTYGGTTNLSATLKTASGTPVGGKSVNFTLNGNAVCGGNTGVTCPTTNSSTGVATLNGASLAGINAGTYATGVGASFAGDTGYSGSNNTGSLTVAKANQTINFQALAPKTYGDPDFKLSVAATSNLPVTLTFSPSTCTVSGEIVHIAHAGTCTITASQPGTDNYNAAADVTRSFEIGKANQSITFAAPAGKTFGDADFDPGARATSGLAVSYSSSTPGVCTIDSQTNKVHIVSAGTCTVTAKQVGNADYNPAADVERSFEIDKATARVDLGNLTQTYDGTVKAASATTVPANLNVDFAYSQNGSAATPRDVGSYDVVATVNNANYQGSARGTLTIDKATARVDLGNLTQTYDGTVKAATASTTPAGLDVNFDYKQNGVAATPRTAGSYDVVATVNSANYQGGARGTLVINRKELTGSFTAENKTYDGNASATIASSSLNGVIDGDVVELAGNEATFDDKNAGTDKTVTVNRGDLSGADAGNYTLAAGPWTTQADITAKELTGSFTADDKVYDGDTSATIATRSVSGKVTGDDVTLVGGTATFADKNVGSAKTVTGTGFSLSGAQSGNYNLKSSTLTTTASITAKQLTVTADVKSKVFGEPNPAFTVSYSGFVNGDDKDDLGGQLQFSTNANAGSSVGSYEVTPSGLTSTNYNINFAKGTLTVTKADLTVTTKDATKTYGDPNPTFDVGYSGFVNGDDRDDLGGTLAFDTNATASSSAGTYDITPKGLTSGNYNINFVKGTLTVNKADLTVTADNK